MAAPPPAGHREQAQELVDSLAKPPKSLGELEHWAIALCTAQCTLKPSVSPATVLVFVADHGVKKEDTTLSPYPPQVTQAVFRALAAGVSATAVLARTNGAHLVVVDVGIDGSVYGVEGASSSISVIHAKISRGTADCRNGLPAIADAATLDKAIEVGRGRVAYEIAERGTKVVAIGEVGIGNTTVAAALLAALVDGADPADCCGRGTGLDDLGLAHKVEVVRQMISAHSYWLKACSGDAEKAKVALERLGGLEIAAMVGAYLEASERRLVALVDGFISGVAALIATRIEPGVRSCLLFATALEEEPGAAKGGAILSKALNASPALCMGLRLGEASGATLALPLLKAAAAIVSEMATLNEAIALGATERMDHLEEEQRRAGAPAD